MTLFFVCPFVTPLRALQIVDYRLADGGAGRDGLFGEEHLGGCRRAGSVVAVPGKGIGVGGRGSGVGVRQGHGRGGPNRTAVDSQTGWTRIPPCEPSRGRGGLADDSDMAWLIYWPLLLVVAAAVAAGVAILVRKLRHKNDNPFIVKR